MRRLVLAAVLLAAVGCTKNYYTQAKVDATPTTPTPVVVTHTIEFRVLGTVPLSDITYGSAQTGSSATQTTLPWTAQFKTKETSLFVYLKASSSYNGTITAQIFVDGVFFREATNNFFGSQNVADASGQLDLSN